MVFFWLKQGKFEGFLGFFLEVFQSRGSNYASWESEQMTGVMYFSEGNRRGKER